MKSEANEGPKKRSFTIRGHRTSVSLEDEFWQCLKELAEREGTSTAALITKIDAQRSQVGLSSAVRTHILRELRRPVSDKIDNG
ncbi:MAG: ribbon-helix-helix domain-containing protein [Pseudomonadota bacterium]